MPRTVRTARGEVVDFDMIVIKNQLAQAPMNIEVQKRKDFIDSKEGKARQRQTPPVVSPVVTPTPVNEFEPIDEPVQVTGRVEEPVPDLPTRNK